MDVPDVLLFPSFVSGSLHFPTKVQLQFPLDCAQYISLPCQGAIDFQAPPGCYQAAYLPCPEQTTSSRALVLDEVEEDAEEREEISKQIASYADQVKDMKERINWLQDNLRHSGSGRSSAEEHAEDLSKIFAAQATKVEELGQQIDVFSEELKQWEDAESRGESRFSVQMLAGEEVDEVSTIPREKQAEFARINITTKDLEMKRKAMAVRKPRHEAKRRKVQDIHRLPFKVGVPGSVRSCDSVSTGRKGQGVRTGQLRKSGFGNDNSTFVRGLQSELLQLKELLEEREQRLREEQSNRYQMETRHALELQTFVKDAEEGMKQERISRLEAEGKIISLEARIKRMEQETDQQQATPRQECRLELLGDDESIGDEVRSNQQDAAAITRFYGEERAISAAQLRRALKLKSIAEAKAENLKRQVAALKKLTGDLQHEHSSRLRREAAASLDAERQLHLKKMIAERTHELEVEQSRRVEEERKSSRLESEVASYKKLAMERASDLKVEKRQKSKIEGQVKELRAQLDALRDQAKPCGQLKLDTQGYESISHKQNRRLQLSLKKLRQRYDQLQEAFRKEQERRLAEGSCFPKFGSACADQLVKLQELESLLAHLSHEVDDRQCKWDDMVNKLKLLDEDKAAFCMDKNNEQQEGEKLLVLLDKLAKGGNEYKHVKQLHKDEEAGVAGKNDRLEKLLSQMRRVTSGMASALKQDLSWGLEGEERQAATHDGVEDEEAVPEELDFFRQQCNSTSISRLTSEEQVKQLTKVCGLQAKRLRTAEAKLLTFKRHVLQLKTIADERSKELEQERLSSRGSEAIAQLKVLEIQLLECKRQGEEKNKDLKHERRLRFELESRSAAELEQLRRELQESRSKQQEYSSRVTQTEEEVALPDIQRALEEAQSREAELRSLLQFAEAEIASANARAEEVSQLSACERHKVIELTGVVELLATRFREQQERETQLESRVEEQERLKLELEGQLDGATRLRGLVEQRVKELEVSEEVLRCRDKLWRRGLLAFDQVLLICFGALFAFNRITLLLRDFTPT